jgi:hypothetical protein
MVIGQLEKKIFQRPEGAKNAIPGVAEAVFAMNPTFQ